MTCYQEITCPNCGSNCSATITLSGRRHTHKIERKNLNFRTWIKRLTRKTICFSKLETMHDTVVSITD